MVLGYRAHSARAALEEGGKHIQHRMQRAPKISRGPFRNKRVPEVRSQEDAARAGFLLCFEDVGLISPPGVKRYSFNK